MRTMMASPSFPYASLTLWASCFVLALMISPLVSVFAANWPKVTRTLRALLAALGVAAFLAVFIVWDCMGVWTWLCTL